MPILLTLTFSVTTVAHTTFLSKKSSRDHRIQRTQTRQTFSQCTTQRKTWIPRPTGRASWKECGLFQQLTKTFFSVALVKSSLLSYRVQGTCNQAPGVPKPSREEACGSENSPSHPHPLPLPLHFSIFPDLLLLAFLKKLLYIYSSSSLPCNKRMRKISLKLYQKEKDGVKLEIPAIYTQ